MMIVKEGLDGWMTAAFSIVKNKRLVGIVLDHGFLDKEFPVGNPVRSCDLTNVSVRDEVVLRPIRPRRQLPLAAGLFIARGMR